MPSKGHSHQYNLVPNDEYDSRVPLHSEEAFQHGITFQAKFIGMLDVPRPTTRVEIVAAMRKIRFEFKSKGIKKKKVTVQVSIEGVKVSLRKKRKKIKDWNNDDDNFLLLNHPIYRIFYVSHDSRDLKIFSYIVRDGSSSNTVFKCAVFKAQKKKQAMRIVRTVGQAFEVCHKLSIEDPDDNYEEEEEEAIMMKTRQDLINDVNSSHQYNKIKNGDNENGCEDLGIGKESITETHTKLRDLFPNIPPVLNHNNKSSPLLMKKSDKIIAESINSDVIPALITEVGNFPSSISAQHHHEMQLLHEQLEQQRQQTQAAIAQLQLVREQLQAEQSARVDAQSRTHQLLLHNRELLDHIAALVSHLNNEGDLNSRSNEKSIPSHIAMPQTRTLPNARNSFNPVNHGGIYNCPYSSNTPSSPNIDNRLETVPRFISTHHFHHQYPYEFLQPPFNNNYYSNNGTDGVHESGLMNHQCPYSTLPRYFSSFESNDRSSMTRHSEPRQIPSSSSLFHSMQDKSFNRCADNEKTIDNKNSQSACGNSCANSSSSKDYSHLIKPLSQLGTLTTRDSEGRIRVIVPSDSSSPEMKLRNGPGGISRSASEKVPNRSELLSQVERTMWARHTTK